MQEQLPKKRCLFVIELNLAIYLSHRSLQNTFFGTSLGGGQIQQFGMRPENKTNFCLFVLEQNPAIDLSYPYSNEFEIPQARVMPVITHFWFAFRGYRHWYPLPSNCGENKKVEEKNVVTMKAKRTVNVISLNINDISTILGKL